jgi:hypothetical protein
MFDRERTLYAFVLNYCRALTADIDESRMADQPVPGANHPAWILGHLAICTDYVAKLVGLPMTCPDAWHKLFGRGSQPAPDRAAYPSKAELLKALADGHERVSAGVAQADPKAMERSQTLTFQRHFPTVGDLVANLMTTHPCTHLGQLSAWRRFNRLPRLPEA